MTHDARRDQLGEELLQAATDGDAKRVKKLLVRGADPNFVSKVALPRARRGRERAR